MKKKETRSTFLKDIPLGRYSIDLFLFLLSFFNSYILMIWLVTLVIYKVLKLRIEGAIEALILIQLRSVLNPGIAVDISEASIIKWICVFALSFFLFCSCYYLSSRRIKSTIWIIILFSAYLAVSSLLTSSYPTVAVFKVVSYAFPFVSIILGIFNSKQIVWIKRINFFLGILILFSFVTIPIPIAYLRNGRFFQGLTNHPNMFGILTALFLAGVFFQQYKKFSLSTAAIFVMCLVMLWFSRSRTGMLSSIVFFIIYILCLEISTIKKIVLSLFITSIVFSVAVIYGGKTVWDYIQEFLYKGYEDSIVYSRLGIIDWGLARFKTNPWLGTGFNVPYEKGVRDFGFSFDLIVENGNLFLALLGDAGIIGALLFLVCYGNIFKKGKGVVLFLAPILISLGEMTFFSTNNIGIILYLYYGIYLANKQGTE